MDIKSSYVVEGIAEDQEKIVALRSQIEDYAREEYGDFDRSELFWSMRTDGHFDYMIVFYK